VPDALAQPTWSAILATPIGRLRLEVTASHVVRVGWTDAPDRTPAPAAPPLLAEACREVQAYARGKRLAFDLPVAPAGTPFQQRVWALMQAIPYGETMTYGEMAAALGSGARAVGGACGKNPIPVIIPCHRVMGSQGRLTGFSGGEGVATKERLLALERGKTEAGLPLFEGHVLSRKSN